jgi:ferritin-like metal-binding protein YciE
MDDAEIHDSLVTHLQQALAAERAQVGELRTLRDEAEIPAVRALLDQHLSATEDHGDRLEQRLAELGAGPSFRLLVQSIGGMIPKQAIDRMRPASECAILRDAISAEAMEIAAYLLLEVEALRGGDESTATLARELRADEVATRDELMTFWNQAVGRDVDRRTTDEEPRTRVARAMLVDQLRDVHALERNAVVMLSTVLATVDDELACERVADHRDATMRHGDEVMRRLHELGSRPSLRRQAQGLAFAAIKGPINLLRAERAAKDLRDMYVVEHLELVGYAQLAVLAELAGDDATLQLAQSQRQEEAAMADWLEREGARFMLETMHASS